MHAFASSDIDWNLINAAVEVNVNDSTVTVSTALVTAWIGSWDIELLVLLKSHLLQRSVNCQ